MNRLKISVIFAIIFAAMGSMALSAQMFTPERKLRYAEQLIERFYVDNVNADSIVEEGIRAMLKTLDPHSLYSTAEETRELTEPLQGNFSGIGIQFNMLNDTLYVIQTIAGGPSEQVGILAGDRIIMANDTLISGAKKQNKDIQAVLRGPRGTVVNVKVKRGASPELIDFRIVRDDIPIYSVDAAYMADPETGYIRISRFAEETASEVASAMSDLRRKGMKNLIIDLEYNGGGYLKPSADIANMFLSRGDTIVYTNGLNVEPAYFIAERNGSMRDGRVVVMVNQYSASASEILSGAVQDNDRGVIVGRRTFGKGLVQRPFPFPDGSMIRLTVSRYFTPAGRCIQKPYTAGDEEEYGRDMLHRLESGELMSADSIQFPDSLRRSTLRLGRPVYGGGGVMPDRFVALDTTYFSKFYRDLVAKGTVSLFCVDYVDANRKALLKDYPDEQTFLDKFEVSPALLAEMVAKGIADGVEYTQEDYDRALPLILASMKGLIGRDLYDQSTYRRVINPYNNIFAEALEIINDPAKYRSYLK